jgi:glycine dehydrogenase subunit 1
LQLKSDAESVVEKLTAKKIFAGIPLGRYYPELKNCLLVCVTEMNKKSQIEQLASELEAAQ